MAGPLFSIDPNRSDTRHGPLYYNPNRPPVFEITNRTNGLRAGMLVHVVDIPHRGDVYTVEVAGEPGSYARVRRDRLKRIWRTPEEQVMGRDFNDDEVAAYEDRERLLLAAHLERSARREVEDQLDRIILYAGRKLEALREARLRDDLSPVQKATLFQRELLWLIPNLDLDKLTSDAMLWTRYASPAQPERAACENALSVQAAS